MPKVLRESNPPNESEDMARSDESPADIINQFVQHGEYETWALRYDWRAFIYLSALHRLHIEEGNQP